MSKFVQDLDTVLNVMERSLVFSDTVSGVLVRAIGSCRAREGGREGRSAGEREEANYPRNKW